jgi:uncharacterized membrane protein
MEFSGLFDFVLRWLHTFAGIIWIGHLYYINFVQGAFMNEIDPPVKTVAQLKLFPKVLWWFRYGALWTFLIGSLILILKFNQIGFDSSSYWTNILTGSLLGTLMFLNVWLIIWPNQKQVIANAERVSKGEAALPGIADRAARALVASRTNVMFSIPMLFFMIAAEWGYAPKESMVPYWVVLFILIGALEFNAIKGKVGPLATVKGALAAGFGLLAVVLGLVVVLAQGSVG